MVVFDNEQMKRLMANQDNIRNVCVIAQFQHGRSTLVENLIEQAGISHAGQAKWPDVRDEEHRPPRISSASESLYFEYDTSGSGSNKQMHLINLINTPGGHTDYLVEIAPTLRITDGTVIVIDCIEGVCNHLETVLKLACQERIKPTLMINKVDRLIIEQKLDGETIYQNFLKIIDQVNQIISTFQHQDMDNTLIISETGNIAFGSGRQNWAFTITTFAKLYTKKFNVNQQKLQNLFWGENYRDVEEKCWTKNSISKSGKPLKRGFVSFILEPIIKLSNAIMDGDTERTISMLSVIQLTISQDEKKLQGKELLKVVMRKWINLSDTILEMITLHLPSPKLAQEKRIAHLQGGAQNDAVFQSMTDCNPQGPLMIFISRMIPWNSSGKLMAFGRVFSGTVSAGQKVKIMGPNYKPGKLEDLYEKAIEKVMIVLEGKAQPIHDVPCGNLVYLVGIDQFIFKSATISDHPEAHTLREIKFSTIPIMKVSVQPKNPHDLPKLIQALTKLAKTDPLAVCTTEEDGQIYVSGCGEQHVEKCLNDLEKFFSPNEFIRSEPLIIYKETVTAESSQICMVKSPNKHNQLYGKALPLNEKLTSAIEQGEITAKDDINLRANQLRQEYDWDQNDALKIISFGPNSSGANILVESNSIHRLNEIRGSLDAAWQWVTKEGVLCEQNMRGVRVNFTDFLSHADAIHRGGGQIIPSARRLYYGCVLSAQPRLQEPVYLTEIRSPIDVLGGIYNLLEKSKGVFLTEEQIPGTPIQLLRAYLPVSESFNFSTELRKQTLGQAATQYMFDHWQTIDDDPFESGSRNQEIILTIREKKGLKVAIPNLHDYLDKL